MSKVIAELLGADRREFDKIISRLEHMCLRPGVDIKLGSEIMSQTRQKSIQLGFDPVDTTKKELYYGLLAKAEKDDAELRTILGINEKTNSFIAGNRIAQNTSKLLKKEVVVALQPITVKKILKAVPPKKTLRLLKFRSIDSVLKRENPLIIYGLAKKIEDKTWNSQIQARLKRLQPGDVLDSKVSVLSLPDGWAEKVHKHSFEHIVFPVAETGTVLIFPTLPLSLKGSVLLTTALVLQVAQRLCVESLPYRTKALSKGYENLLPEISAGKTEQIKPIFGLQPNWHTVYQLLATQAKKRIPEFELVIGDLEWESIEAKLVSICKNLDFWINSHYLGISGSPKCTSFNLVDVTASLVLDKKYNNQITSHMRASLWNELQFRYMKQEVLEQSLISQMTGV